MSIHELDRILDPMIAKCMQSKVLTLCGGILALCCTLGTCVAIPYVVQFPRYNSHLVGLLLVGGVSLSLGFILSARFIKLMRGNNNAEPDLNLPYSLRGAREPIPERLLTIGEMLENLPDSSACYFLSEIREPRPPRNLTKTKKSSKASELYLSNETLRLQDIHEGLTNSSDSSPTFLSDEEREPRPVRHKTLTRLPKTSDSRLSYFSHAAGELRSLRFQNLTDQLLKRTLNKIQKEEELPEHSFSRQLEGIENSKRCEDFFEMEGYPNIFSSSSGSEKSFTSSDDSATTRNRKGTLRISAVVKHDHS